MKYYEVEFTLTPCSQDARDLLSALAGEVGFETFEDMPNGLTGYVQQQLFDRDALTSILEGFPLEGTNIIYNVREAEDRDWNEQWEQEGFDPICIDHRLTIHDGRHLPVKATPINIEIDARLAFGTGTHETTRMICATLLELYGPDSPYPHLDRILDCGCGTGILGICALKLGAKSCTSYDIDEWSVDNTRHNSVINYVDELLTALHGDATLLDSFHEHFNLVMANINRNILLQDMERMVGVMTETGVLILSGFYQSDCDILIQKAKTLGLSLHKKRSDGDWSCLIFVRK